ncbi:histidine kinase [Limnochorda pilosa]|uniref:histidine kinase n=1 Tax=Limnochorda pilosa TaxID=1555112 RepID=A0A0K2SFP6_LIMPI|nr:histidine kinase [Limnochorda pilosa]BAS25926.1 histidine kinase [Limnochorda pilosa]
MLSFHFWVAAGAAAGFLPALIAFGPSVAVGVAFAGVELVLHLLIYVEVTRARRREPRLEGLPAGGSGARWSSSARLVEQTLPYWRAGFTEEGARRTVRLLASLTGCPWVGITDTERLLAAWPGADRLSGADPPGGAEAAQMGLDRLTQRVLASGRPADESEEVPGSGLLVRYAVPLRSRGQAVGTLQVQHAATSAGRAVREQMEGLAQILSLQIELADMSRQAELLAVAELNALRAQINPHFLFNTLNTIAARIRTDPVAARRLLLKLSEFFRYGVRQTGQLVPFSQEFHLVRTYLFLEKARYGDRLRVRYDIDPEVLGAEVPAFVLQPLVENAVRHGVGPKREGGQVLVVAYIDPLTRSLVLAVRDDGAGMDAPRRDVLPGQETEGEGVGLRNIQERLTRLYGEAFRFQIESRPGKGTSVLLRLPLSAAREPGWEPVPRGSLRTGVRA